MHSYLCPNKLKCELELIFRPNFDPKNIRFLHEKNSRFVSCRFVSCISCRLFDFTHEWRPCGVLKCRFEYTNYSYKTHRSKTVPIPFQDRSKYRSKTVPNTVPRPFQERSKTVPRPFQRPFQDRSKDRSNTVPIPFQDRSNKNRNYFFMFQPLVRDLKKLHFDFNEFHSVDLSKITPITSIFIGTVLERYWNGIGTVLKRSWNGLWTVLTVPLPFQYRSKTVPRPFQRPFQYRSKTVPRPFQ
jgi:hypothetical protein